MPALTSTTSCPRAMSSPVAGAGTGTIDADGNVGDIGGIQPSASREGRRRELFVAPRRQAADAQAILGNAVLGHRGAHVRKALAALA